MVGKGQEEPGVETEAGGLVAGEQRDPEKPSRQSGLQGPRSQMLLMLGAPESVLSVGGGIFPNPGNYGGFLRMLAAFLPGPGVKGAFCLCRKQGPFPFLPVATCLGFLSVLSKDVAAV